MTWPLFRRCLVTALFAIVLALVFNVLLKATLGEPIELSEAFWIETAPIMFLVGFFLPLAPRPGLDR